MKEGRLEGLRWTGADTKMESRSRASLECGITQFLYVLGSTLNLNFMDLSLPVFNIIFSTYSLAHGCT